VTCHEVFQFLAYRWDITRAWEIADGLPVRTFNVEPWFGLLGPIQIDEDHLASADLDRPILMVKIRELGGSVLIADGWHRLAKAQRDGAPTCRSLCSTKTRNTTRGSGAAAKEHRSPADRTAKPWLRRARAAQPAMTAQRITSTTTCGQDPRRLLDQPAGRRARRSPEEPPESRQARRRPAPAAPAREGRHPR
jgi:hypothetical protein